MSFVANQWLEDQQPRLIDTLKSWSNINSGSFNAEGVRAMAATIKSFADEAFNVDAEVHDLPPIKQIDAQGNAELRPIGPLLTLSKRPELKNRILLCGHIDTVFPERSDFQSWHQINQNTLGGPGVADMKGGILVMMAALQAFEQTPAASELGWDIVLNSDEEIGSHSSAPHLVEAAQGAQLGMIFEPSMPDGWLAGARKGSGNYSLVVHGKPAHAGREYHLGRNAIAALSATMHELDQLNVLSESSTLNLARISGGGPNNVVPDLAIVHFNIRVTSLADQDFAENHVAQAVEKLTAREGFSVELHGGFSRPPKPATAQQEKLFDLVRVCGGELGVDLGFRATGGCCDGNNLLAAGLPNIDTLGVQGGDIHSDQEYMLMDSLVERSQLSHLILQKIATDASTWLI